MSAQTVIHPSIFSIKKEAEDIFISNAKKLLLKNGYALGEGYCSFEQADSVIIYDIINLNNCKIFSLINKEIEFVEDECKEDIDNITESCEMTNSSNNCNSTDSVSVIYELWLSKGNSGTMDEFLELILKNDDVSSNWDEIND